MGFRISTFSYSQMNSPLQVKSYQLTFWRKNEAGRAEKDEFSTTKHVKTNSTFWRFCSLKIPLYALRLMILNRFFQKKWKTLG